MFVAIPTAIPDAPLSSRFGSLAGRSTGSCRLASKLSTKSTVSSSRLTSISSAAELSRASVYRIAAGGSLSTLPKFPCPSTSCTRIEKSWAMRTMAS